MNKDKTTISRHISKIQKNDSTVAYDATVQIEGNKEVRRSIKLYNLDVIKEISKRSKSESGYEFINWANDIINCNQHNTLPEISLNEDVKSKIYYIRGERVMLDFELAELYGYDTKRFNEQVKNNIEKFPSRYMFQITKS